MDANESNGHQDDRGSDTQQLPASIERRDTAINDSNSNSGAKKEKYWPQRIETICAVLLVVITGTYTYYANKQWSAMKGQLKEMQSQTTLSRQQLIGAQAAIVVVAEYPGIEIPNYGFNIGLRNDGHVIATNVHVLLKAQRQNVDNTEPVGEPWQCVYDLAPIAPTKVGEHQCFLKGLDRVNWQPIGEFKQTIAIDGSFTYWNGFENAATQTICIRYIPGGLKSKFGSEGPGSFVSCDRYPGWIEYLKERMAGNGEGTSAPPRQ